MISGIGIDIVDIRRIDKLLKKNGERFLHKIFTAEEIEISKNYRGKKYAAYFAKRFAAKEAVAKALSSGFGKNLEWREINIGKEKSGRPVIMLKGKARKLAGENTSLHLSISDEYPFAVAMVAMEGGD